MKRKKQRKEVVASVGCRRFEPNTSVKILRPNLWSGHYGTVVDEKDGMHLICVTGPAGVFPALIPGNELEAL